MVMWGGSSFPFLKLHSPDVQGPLSKGLTFVGGSCIFGGEVLCNFLPIICIVRVCVAKYWGHLQCGVGEASLFWKGFMSNSWSGQKTTISPAAFQSESRGKQLYSAAKN